MNNWKKLENTEKLRIFSCEETLLYIFNSGFAGMYNVVIEDAHETQLTIERMNFTQVLDKYGIKISI
jgi:hypothetical protein